MNSSRPSCYTEALDVYKGDFLLEVSDAPWVDRRRTVFRAKYIELFYALARVYEKQGA